MYAIVESGGKQYRVEKGQWVLVDRLPAPEGEKVQLRPLLFRSEEVVFDGKDLEKVKVEAVVQAHVRGPKIRVFKYKPKKGYRKRAGHRSELTRLEITKIQGPTTRAASPKTEEKPAARKPSATKKPPAKKPAPKKETADGS